MRRPAQAIYEHKIWVLLDIDQVMIDIQSWRETLTSDDETSRGMLVEFSLVFFVTQSHDAAHVCSRHFAQQRHISPLIILDNHKVGARAPWKKRQRK